MVFNSSVVMPSLTKGLIMDNTSAANCPTKRIFSISSGDLMITDMLPLSVKKLMLA